MAGTGDLTAGWGRCGVCGEPGGDPSSPIPSCHPSWGKDWGKERAERFSECCHHGNPFPSIPGMLLVWGGHRALGEHQGREWGRGSRKGESLALRAGQGQCAMGSGKLIPASALALPVRVGQPLRGLKGHPGRHEGEWGQARVLPADEGSEGNCLWSRTPESPAMRNLLLDTKPGEQGWENIP